MPISETDLDLLEEYLDGALDATAIANLQGRLAIDKDLSAELVLSRSQRAVRLAAFKSMEPDAATAEQLVWRIRGAMHDQQQQKQIQSARGWSQWRIARIGSAAAACLVFGFFAGRLTHGTAVNHDLNVSGISQTSPRCECGCSEARRSTCRAICRRKPHASDFGTGHQRIWPGGCLAGIR